MKYSKRLEIFEQVRAKYCKFLTSILWKLAGDKEIFTEAMQYALLGMWKNIEKLNSTKAGAYIYRIALTANSKAWRNRVGRDGEINKTQTVLEKNAEDNADKSELNKKIKKAIAQLPTKQSRAIVMRYLEQQSYDVIAERLHCSEAGARSNVSKALASLKDKLAVLSEQEQ